MIKMKNKYNRAKNCVIEFSSNIKIFFILILMCPSVFFHSAGATDRPAETEDLLARIPPVIGDFEACVDVMPVQGLVLVRDIRNIVLNSIFWRLREDGLHIDAIEAKIAIASSQIERMKRISLQYLIQIVDDPSKIDGHCEHVAMTTAVLLSRLK